jgi:hypothetical protein
MGEGSSFYGSPTTGGRRDRRIATVVIVLLVAGVGIAIAKPWGSPVEPAPPSGLPEAEATTPARSLPTTTPELPSAAPSASVGPLPLAFTTALPPLSATWTGLTWRRLAPDDPLGLVTSVVRWRHGFVAVGAIGSPPFTPVWTSADGAQWQPVPFDTSTTFWPGYVVLGVAEVPAGLVVLTDCGGSPCSLQYGPRVISWTSPNGRAWTPHIVLTAGWLSGPTTSPPLVAVGPAGMVAASRRPAERIARSPDGVEWRFLPTSTLPASFWLDDLEGTGTGYVAVGRQMTADAHLVAASLWSADGQHWSGPPTLLPTSPRSGPDDGSAAVSLVVGRNGIVAVERGVASPGAALWWQSPDGRRWRLLPTFDPLGPTTCTGDGCSVQTNGTLVGDGQRMVAVRNGADGGAWTSTDGLTWSRLGITGDIPGEQPTNAALLPGGVLLSDGTTTWFGEAQGP